MGRDGMRRAGIHIIVINCMSGREEEMAAREPLSPRKGRERQGLQEIRQGYAQIADRLSTRVKKPLQNLKAMVEAELERLRQD